MESVRTIETVDLALETVYKSETDTETVYRIKSASVNGLNLPPIELRVPHNADAAQETRIRSVGGTYVPVQLIGHTCKIQTRNSATRLKTEKRTVQHKRMRSFAHQILTIPTT